MLKGSSVRVLWNSCSVRSVTGEGVEERGVEGVQDK